MTTITLNLSPELEHRLRTEAVRQGVELNHYILNALQAPLQHTSATTQTTEAELLQQINVGFSTQTWEQYHSLISKRQAETLTPEEHNQLIQLSDRLEKLNVVRIQALIQLAALRSQPLTDLMQTLGIHPNPEIMDYA